MSGSCKCEDVSSQQQLLETAQTELQEKVQDIRRQMYTITSDGDSHCHPTTCLITLVHQLEPHSLLFQKLGQLHLFNYVCGSHNLTGDIEYKHLIKQL